MDKDKYFDLLKSSAEDEGSEQKGGFNNLLGECRKSAKQEVDEEQDEKYPSGHPSGNIFHGDKVKVLHGGHKGEIGEVVDIMTPDEDPEEFPDGQFDVEMEDGKTIYLGWDDVKLVESKVDEQDTEKRIGNIKAELKKLQKQLSGVPLDDADKIKKKIANLKAEKAKLKKTIESKADESKLKEQKDILVTITGGEDEGKPGVVTNWVKGLGYQDVHFEGKKKQIGYKYLKVGDRTAEQFDEDMVVENESKVNEQEPGEEELERPEKPRRAEPREEPDPGAPPAPPERVKDAPKPMEMRKEYLGKTEDTHFYFLTVEGGAGDIDDFVVTDQEGVKKYSAKDQNIEVVEENTAEFLIQAIRDINIAQIERSIFMKYIYPELIKEEPEEEIIEEPDERPEEEVPLTPEEEEERPRESRKVNEIKNIKDFNKKELKNLLSKFKKLHDFCPGDLKLDAQIGKIESAIKDPESEVDEKKKVNEQREEWYKAVAVVDAIEKLLDDFAVEEEDKEMADSLIQELKSYLEAMKSKVTKETDEKKKAPKCDKCGKVHWPFQKCKKVEEKINENREKIYRLLSIAQLSAGAITDKNWYDRKSEIIRTLNQLEEALEAELSEFRTSEKKKAPKCDKCGKVHWPFQKCKEAKEEWEPAILTKEGKKSKYVLISTTGRIRPDHLFKSLEDAKAKGWKRKADEQKVDEALEYSGALCPKCKKEVVLNTKMHTLECLSCGWGSDEISPEASETKTNVDEEVKENYLIEMKVTDDGGNEFDVYLVDDGTTDTVISISGREFRFSSEFASMWRDEEGGLSEEGLRELALDALSNLEQEEYDELIGMAAAEEAEKEKAEKEELAVGSESPEAEPHVEGKEVTEGYKEMEAELDILDQMSYEELRDAAGEAGKRVSEEADFIDIIMHDKFGDEYTKYLKRQVGFEKKNNERDSDMNVNEEQIDPTKLGDDELIAKYVELDATMERGEGDDDTLRNITALFDEINNRGLDIGKSKNEEKKNNERDSDMNEKKSADAILKVADKKEKEAKALRDEAKALRANAAKMAKEEKNAAAEKAKKAAKTDEGKNPKAGDSEAVKIKKLAEEDKEEKVDEGNVNETDVAKGVKELIRLTKEALAAGEYNKAAEWCQKLAEIENVVPSEAEREAAKEEPKKDEKPDDDVPEKPDEENADEHVEKKLDATPEEPVAEDKKSKIQVENTTNTMDVTERKSIERLHGLSDHLIK